MSGLGTMKGQLLAGERRTYQPVRRDSFDVEDRRAQVARPNPWGMAFVDGLMRVLAEWDDYTKEVGKRHRFGLAGQKVLRAILSCWDFKKGICEPCIDTIMSKTKLARATVVRAIRNLEADGFMDHIRRTERTGNAPGEGPQVKQVSNAYWFDPSRLHKKCYDRLQQLLRRKGKSLTDAKVTYPRFDGILARRKAAIVSATAYKAACFRRATSPEEQARIIYPGDERAQAEHVAMLKGASSVTGLNPLLSRSIHKE